MARDDVISSSVSCIYGIGSLMSTKKEQKKFQMEKI